MSTRVRIAAALAAGAGLAALFLTLRGSGGGAGPSATDEPAPAPAAPLVYRDGRAGPVSAEQLPRLAEILGQRRPGLVVIAGTVREAHADEPLPGAEVVFAGPRGESSTVADDRGRYAIELRPGFYRAYARAEGYVAVAPAPIDRLPAPPRTGEAGLPVSDLAPAIGAFRDQSGVDLHLHRGGTVTGTVYDGDGHPVPGAVVAARRRSTGGVLRLVLGTDTDVTDWSGTYRLEVPAGRIALHAAHDDFAGLERGSRNRLFLHPEERARVDLTLAAGCIITGQAVDVRGAPAGPGALEATIGGGEFTPVGRLDDEGRFRLATTTRGETTLRAWPWKSPPSRPHVFRCDDGARHTDVTFRIPDAEPDVEGTIVDANGNPVPGAYIDVYPLSPGGISQQERADGDGAFAFYALPPGEYQLTAHVPGEGVAAEPIRAPTRGVRLGLSGTGSLVGSVQDMGNGSFTLVVQRCAVPWPDDTVARIDSITMPPNRIVVPVQNGTFRVDGLPACALSARAELPRRTRRVHVRISPHRPATVEL